MATVEKLIQPLPWRAEAGGEYGGRVKDADGHTVTNQVTQDEAELICRAVNAHEELIAALKAYVAACRAQGIKLGSITGDAEALIAKAEGRA